VKNYFKIYGRIPLISRIIESFHTELFITVAIGYFRVINGFYNCSECHREQHRCYYIP